MVADCLERVGAGEALWFDRPARWDPKGLGWRFVASRCPTSRHPCCGGLGVGCLVRVRERLDAGERLLVVSPHELEVPEHVSRVEIVLKPLSLADVRRSLVSVAPKSQDPASVAATLHEWTGGLPRLLADLLENHTENDDFSLPEKDAVNASVNGF